MQIIVENINNFGESIEIDQTSIDFSNVEVNMEDVYDPTIVNASSCINVRQVQTPRQTPSTSVARSSLTTPISKTSSSSTHL